MINLIMAMDDTDNLESPGTGHLLEEFRSYITERQWGTSQPISRHQLFVDPRVPYTSHNSTMCFTARVKPELLDLIEKEAVHFLISKAATGSDPGLAIADMDSLSGIQELMKFGARAQNSVLTKEDAYNQASRTGVRLSEHGGTGDGVIGALAGIGLRLSGNDGRFRGQIEGIESPGEFSVNRLAAISRIDDIILVDPSQLPLVKSPSSLNAFLEKGEYLSASDRVVQLRGKVKTILRFHRSVLLLREERGSLTNWSKEDLKVF